MLPRGIRNNNPLNIVHGKSCWLGRSEKQTDQNFVQFASMEYGIRAALVLLRRYMRDFHLCCVRDIVRRWCPDATAGEYAAMVSRRTGFSLSQPLDWRCKSHIVPLAIAMAEVECGWLVSDKSRFLSPSMFDRAYEML